MREFIQSHRKMSLFVAIIIAGTITAMATKIGPFKEKEQTMKEFLYESGFKVVPDLTGSKYADYWKNQYGLRFISDADMKMLCDSNGFIVLPSQNYSQTIPETAAKEMMKNYTKIKDDMLSYEFFAYDEGPKYWMEGSFNDREHDPTLGNKLFTLAGSEVKSKIRHKDRWRGEVSRTFPFWDRDEDLDVVIPESVLTRYNINPDSYKDNWIMIRNKNMERINIVAHHSQFDLDTVKVDPAIIVKPPKRDPIAVIKHRGGWVVLAHWM